MSNKVFTYKEIRDFLIKVLGFSFKGSIGSHEKYEGYYKEKRRVVTLDSKHDKLPSKIQKQNIFSMIKQMGFSNKTDPDFKKKFFNLSESIVASDIRKETES